MRAALSLECLKYAIGRELIWCLYYWSGLNLVWQVGQQVGSVELAQASGLVAQNESSLLSEELSSEREQQRLPLLCFEGSPKRSPLAWARVVSLERYGLAWARPRRAHYCNLAQAKSGSLSDGFLLPKQELLLLGEINNVDWISVCFLMFGWCVTLQSHVRCLVCIIYDTMGMELMSLVWSCIWNMIGWLVVYIGMRLVCMITLCWLVRHDFWYDLGRNSMNLMVRSHGGASWSGRNSMTLFSRSS